MSMYGCWAIDSVWPLKLQKTWLSGYWPFVWLTMANSRTLCAAGIALVLPQNAVGGSPVPPPPAGLTVQLKVAELVAPVVSVAVTVAVLVAAVVGVPEIRPVDALMDSPAGSP